MSDRKPIQLTLPLSELPSQRYRSGSMRCSDAVKEALREALKRSGLSRDVIAEETSRLTGEKIGTNQLDNWAAPEKKDRRIPLEFAAALSVVLSDASIAQAALESAEMLVLSKQHVPYYHLGKLTHEKRERRKEEKKILEAIKG